MANKKVPYDLKRTRLTIRLPNWLKKWLVKKGDQGKTIEKALIEKYDEEMEFLRDE